MQIVPGLHLVDGMEAAGVNVYVWERPDGGLTLIDAGMPRSGDVILRFLAGLGQERLDRIIVTHADVDHIGALAKIKAATGARVIGHVVEREMIEGRQRRWPARSPLGLLILPLYLLIGAVFLRFPRVQLDEMVLDKDVLPEGFQVIHAPGHTPGQIALFEPERGILVAGDALNNRGGRLAGPLPLFTPQMEIAQDSIRKLARLRNLRVLCFGHGPPITEGAAERLQAFADSL